MKRVSGVKRAINFIHLAALTVLFFVTVFPDVWWVWIPGIPAVLWTCVEPETREMIVVRTYAWLAAQLQ